MTDPTSLRLRRLLAGCALATGLVHAGDAAAQFVSPVTGFAPLPSFAWAPPLNGESRWTGSYARMSTGFEVSSSKRFGSQAGPTIGFEGGRLWQEGPVLYGIEGGFDYLAPVGPVRPGLGGLSYTRDFAGGVGVKVGTLVAPDVLVYAKAGALAVHETWRAGPIASPFAITREDLAVRPDARAGVEWAITDRLSVAVEAGVTGRGGSRW